MNRQDLGHGLGFVAALLAAALAGDLDTVQRASAPQVDPTGARRIVSLSPVADGVLAELVEPDRLVATTSWLDGHPRGWRVGARPRIDDLSDLERILALRPDLVIVSAADPNRVARLREAGIDVRDHGPIGGKDSLSDAIEAISGWIGAPERGAALRRTLDARRAAIGEASHKPAIYVTDVGSGLWGGAVGTSYHDVLVDAGLRDVAAEAGLRGWPALRIEQLVSLDPAIIVGEPGTRDTLCGRPELSGLTACRTQAVIELPTKIISDPGPGMVDAAEQLHDAVGR